MRLPHRGPVLLAVLVAVLLLAFFAPTGEAGLPEQRVVAGPGAWVSTYATPALAVEEAGSLTFLNADLMRHDVVSRESGPGDQPWCGRFPAGQCPVFWTPLIGLGEEAPVSGLENLAAGSIYDFYCSLHPGMTGRLVALPKTG